MSYKNWWALSGMLLIVFSTQVISFTRSNVEGVSNYDQKILPRTITIDPQTILVIRDILKNGGNSSAKIALDWIVNQSELILSQKPHSVIEKAELPPSNDKHDFLALAPYRWPDPTKPDGLPYLDHDGAVNPEIASIPDKKNMNDMINKVKILSRAYYLTNNSDYVSKAIELLQVWFMDKNTRMNPNFNYGELNRGIEKINSGGLMAGSNLTDILDSIGLISSSSEWNNSYQNKINSWFNNYLDWLLKSESGQKESKKLNNHRTFYSVQAASIAVFLNRTDDAKKIFKDTTKVQLPLSIEADGSQPQELRRTKALSYSILNLAGLMKLANVGKHIGINLWNYNTPRGATLEKAIDFLIPYIEKKQIWPYPQIVPVMTNTVDDMLCPAFIHYQKQSYLEAYNYINHSNTAAKIDYSICNNTLK